LSVPFATDSNQETLISLRKQFLVPCDQFSQMYVVSIYELVTSSRYMSGTKSRLTNELTGFSMSTFIPQQAIPELLSSYREAW